MQQLINLLKNFSMTLTTKFKMEYSNEDNLKIFMTKQWERLMILRIKSRAKMQEHI